MRIKNTLMLLATVVIVVCVVVLAAGNLTWAPGGAAGAAETALTADPLIRPQETLPQQEVPGPSQELMSELYDAVLPSVVNIQVSQNIMADPGFGIPGVPAQGEGSGWIWDSEGHIVTNNHVVENATEIIVYFYNGLWADAELVASDPQADLAVLQVTAPDGVELRPLPLAADVPSVGYYALAFGSPFGLAGTMTMGIISAVGRSFPVGDPTELGGQYSLPDVIQTDAAINPGNSGGPLVNLNGEVVGVNFAIRSEVRANAGVGFAIPVSVVRRVVPALIEEGAYAYPFLGIGGGTVNPQIAEEEGLPEGTLGVFVARVEAGGPAAEAGVQEGDIITAIDGVEVLTFEDLTGHLITETQPGDIVELQILRGGEVETLTVTLGERPTGEAAPSGQVTVGQAIDIATEAVLAAGFMETIDSTSARTEALEGRQVWIVLLEGDGQQATVVVDAITGEVLDMTVEDAS